MTSSFVKFAWSKRKVEDVRRQVTVGLLRMGSDVASRARSNAPVLTGALRNSIRVTADGEDVVYVLAGGSVAGKNIRYALRREFENKKNPQTLRYMGRAFESVARSDIKRYFKGIK